MLTTLQIDGLEVYGHHGLFEEERRLGQKFIFDVAATLHKTVTHSHDDLDGSVRYDAMADLIAEIAGTTTYQTLEALGEALALALLRRFDPIETISVGIRKLNPPIRHTVRGIGVTVRLSRSDVERVFPMKSPVQQEPA
jgi:dihydroneopterin aldolase